MISKILNKDRDCVYQFVLFDTLFYIYLHVVSCANVISSRGRQISGRSSCCFAVFRVFLHVKMCTFRNSSTHMKGRETCSDQILTTTIAFLLQM